MAITEYTKAIELVPDDALAYYDRGSSYFELGQYQTGFADYTKAIELDPDYPGHYYIRGDSYLQLGQYALAKADQAKACQLDPRNHCWYVDETGEIKKITPVTQP